MRRNIIFLLLIFLLAMSCKDQSKPEDVAERFLSAYLDCRFSDAEPLASSQVLEQMRWRMSNFTQAEVELLGENEPQVAIEETHDFGDSCVVWLNASNALLLDSIDQPGHIGNQRFGLALKKEKGSTWLVTALIYNL